MAVLHKMYTIAVVDLGSSYRIDLYRKLDRSKQEDSPAVWGDVHHAEFLTHLEILHKSEPLPPLDKIMERAAEEAKRF